MQFRYHCQNTFPAGSFIKRTNSNLPTFYIVLRGHVSWSVRFTSRTARDLDRLPDPDRRAIFAAVRAFAAGAIAEEKNRHGRCGHRHFSACDLRVHSDNGQNEADRDSNGVRDR